MKELYKNIVLLSLLVGMVLLFYGTPHNNEVEEASRYTSTSVPGFVPNYSMMITIQDLIVDNTSTNITTTNVSGDK